MMKSIKIWSKNLDSKEVYMIFKIILFILIFLVIKNLIIKIFTKKILKEINDQD